MVYTLSSDFFDEIAITAFSDILFPFAITQRPDTKMAVDIYNIIIGRYKEVLGSRHKDVFDIWLQMMNVHKETSFAVVNVDLTPVPKNKYCLTVAASVKGERKLIVKSFQTFPFPNNDDDCVDFEGQHIPIIERHNAMHEINNHRNVINNVSVINSQEVEVNINSNNTNYE